MNLLCSIGDLAHIEFFREAATPCIDTVRNYLELMQESYIAKENHTAVH